MEKTKKNQLMIISIIIILLIIVIFITVKSIIKYVKPSSTEPAIKLNQIYSSDYSLYAIDTSYFFGSYEPKTIDVIIDNTGREIYTPNESLSYESIHKIKDNRYLLYNNDNNSLTTFIFDGNKIINGLTVEGVDNAKPILYKGPEYDYVVAFYNIKDDNLYIYNIDNNNIIEIKNGILMPDTITNNSYYINNENYLIVKNKDNKMGVIDLNGNFIIDYKYDNIISCKNDTFIALNSNNKYGIINKNDETLLKFNYKVIKLYEDNYLVVNSSNQLALYDKELNNVTGFKMKYDSILEYDLRNNDSLYLTKLNGNIVISNNYLEDYNGIEYLNHNLYVINNNKIWKNIEEIGFYHDTRLYTYDKEYNITIYDENYEKISHIKLDDASKIESIKTLTDNIIIINYLDLSHNKKTKYLEENEELKDTPLYEEGNLYLKTYMYNIFVKEENENKIVSIYKANQTAKTSITCKDFKIDQEYIIIDKAIYKIEIS